VKTVKAVRALASICWQLQKRTQGDGGFWKNLPPPTEGWLAMQEQHSIKNVVIKDWQSNGDDRKSDQGQVARGTSEGQTFGATGMQHQYKEPGPKRAIMSGK
jgi:hypothetical protein